jgi:VIT1/CCC1 family predicted Fe2+/Mn2+ transporter
MPQTAHVEKHFNASEIVRDVVIGISDGLTVPFALAAGLTAAVASTQVVVTAGLAEVAAGSIAMGLGGYLAARSDAEHYLREMRREHREVEEIPDEEREEVARVFRDYGLSADEIAPIVRSLTERPQVWVDFMMKYELGLEQPSPGRALKSALTIAGSYVAGGLIPLAPYFAVHDLTHALLISIAVTLIALLTFGYVKALFTGINPVRGALQTTLIGSLAAGAAFAIARAIR